MNAQSLIALVVRAFTSSSNAVAVVPAAVEPIVDRKELIEYAMNWHESMMGWGQYCASVAEQADGQEAERWLSWKDEYFADSMRCLQVAIDLLHMPVQEMNELYMTIRPQIGK